MAQVGVGAQEWKVAQDRCGVGQGGGKQVCEWH